MPTTELKAHADAQLHSLEDQAVFALAEICREYLSRRKFKTQRMYKRKDTGLNFSVGDGGLNDLFNSGRLDILEEPVRYALRNGMVLIGETLFQQTGSTAIMMKVLERLEDDFGEDGHHVASVLDHAFDGIGGWMA
jgi:hypothetical protein